MSAAVCASCGRTFAGDAAFDAHRVGPMSARTCLDVGRSRRWRRNAYGAWTNARTARVPVPAEGVRKSRAFAREGYSDVQTGPAAVLGAMEAGNGR